MTNRVYDFTLAGNVGATQRIDVSGTYVRLLSSSGGPVRVTLDGGDVIELRAGQGVRTSVPFRSISVTNLQAVANQGALFAGTHYFDFALQPPITKTTAGSQYFATVGKSANPAAFSIAGVRAAASRATAINALKFGADVAGAVRMFICTGDPTVAATVTLGAGKNKLLGTGNSALTSITGECAAATPTGVELPGVVGVGFMYVVANQYTDFPLVNPWVLPPGYGLVLVGGAVNQGVQMILDIEE